MTGIHDMNALGPFDFVGQVLPKLRRCQQVILSGDYQDPGSDFREPFPNIKPVAGLKVSVSHGWRAFQVVVQNGLDTRRVGFRGNRELFG